MTIKELITELEKHPKDTEIYLGFRDYSFPGNFVEKVNSVTEFIIDWDIENDFNEDNIKSVLCVSNAEHKPKE